MRTKFDGIRLEQLMHTINTGETVIINIAGEMNVGNILKKPALS